MAAAQPDVAFEMAEAAPSTSHVGLPWNQLMALFTRK